MTVSYGRKMFMKLPPDHSCKLCRLLNRCSAKKKLMLIRDDFVLNAADVRPYDF